jgi:glyoxylase-like metal-dependent hydrolase (beta-lactamase superfamily II)
MSSTFQQIRQFLWVKQNNPYATNSGIVIWRNQACLIDPGISPADCAEISDFVTGHGASTNTIILTHAHWDHLMGIQCAPQARILTQQNYRDIIRIHAKDLIHQVRAWWLSAYPASHFSWSPPMPDVCYQRDAVVYMQDLILHLYHMPGHTKDHSVVFFPQGKILWAGDMLSDREIPLVEDIRSYSQSLEILSAMDIEMVVPGHGTSAVNAGDSRIRITQDTDYIHNLKSCVRQALEQNCDISQTVAQCSDICFAQPDSYPHAHIWNIESTYLSLGGATDTISGWEVEWNTIVK